MYFKTSSIGIFNVFYLLSFDHQQSWSSPHSGPSSLAKLQDHVFLPANHGRPGVGQGHASGRKLSCTKELAESLCYMLNAKQ